MSQALRKLTATIKKTNTMVIFINQIRMKIGVMFGNARNHHRRQRAEVLRLGAARHPPHRQHQEGRRGHRQRDQGQGRQEQGRAAVQDRRVRHPLRRRHQPRRRDHRHGRRGARCSRSAAPGTPTTARRSARARTTRASSCARTPTSRVEIENKVREAMGIPLLPGAEATTPAGQAEGRQGLIVRRGGSHGSPARPAVAEGRALQLLAQRDQSRLELRAQAAAPCRGRSPRRGAARGRRLDAASARATRRRGGRCRRSPTAARSRRCSTGSRRTATSRPSASSNRACMRARPASATGASGRSWRSTASRCRPRRSQALAESELQRAAAVRERRFQAPPRDAAERARAGALSRRPRLFGRGDPARPAALTPTPSRRGTPPMRRAIAAPDRASRCSRLDQSGTSVAAATFRPPTLSGLLPARLPAPSASTCDDHRPR